MDESSAAWADRWITIQWALVGVAVVSIVVIAFYLTKGSDTTPVHSR